MSSPVDGAARDGDPRDRLPQRVLPLVVRVERADPPARTDALEAAAVAVLTLLADVRAGGPGHLPATAGSGDPGADDAAIEGAGGAGHVAAADGSGDPPADDAGVGGDDPGEGEWSTAVREWTDARIRKVVRRARGAEWRRAEALDGITVTRGSAQVRVFPPVPLDGWPRDLARLQVSGTDLADPEPPGPPPPGVPVLWLRPGLEMTAGKAMAQVGHAAQLGWEAAGRPAGWAAAGFPLAVRTATPQQWAELTGAGLPTVRDAGFTEVAPGTETAIAQLCR